MQLYHRVLSPKDADKMANSVDLDQTAPRSSLIWVYSLPKPACPKTLDHNDMHSYTSKALLYTIFLRTLFSLMFLNLITHKFNILTKNFVISNLH